jgi:hypothetical protein
VPIASTLTGGLAEPSWPAVLVKRHQLTVERHQLGYVAAELDQFRI